MRRGARSRSRSKSKSPPRRQRDSREAHRSRSRSPSRSLQIETRDKYPENRPLPSRKPQAVKPNLEKTGKLVAEHLTRNGVLLKYGEPREACMPDRKFRFHVFKGEDQVAVVPLHTKSCFFFARDLKV